MEADLHYNNAPRSVFLFNVTWSLKGHFKKNIVFCVRQGQLCLMIWRASVNIHGSYLEESHERNKCAHDQGEINVFVFLYVLFCFELEPAYQSV